MKKQKKETEFKKNHRLMAEWNKKREEAENKGIKKFWEMYSDPLLHASKFKKIKPLT